MHHEGPGLHRPSDKSVVTGRETPAPSIPCQRQFRRNGSQPTMQFSLHPPYREVRRTFIRPLHGAGIHQRIFGHHIPSSLDTLPSFPMRAALPRSEYYNGSAPPAPSASVAPIPGIPALDGSGTRGTVTDGSHVHCCSVDGLGIRLCPCGLANGYAVDIHRGLPTQAQETRSGVPRPS